MKKIVVLWVALLCSLSFSQSYHADYKNVDVHSPFRWVVADSTARVALTVTAKDTQKLCFQIADTTIWMLSDDSPKNWTWVSGKKADSLWIRTFQAVTAGITRANMDTSHTRHATGDSATFPVLKGAKTIRDTTTFTGGAYFAGIGRFAGALIAPVADIDSFVGNVKINGNAILSTVETTNGTARPDYLDLGWTYSLVDSAIACKVFLHSSKAFGFGLGNESDVQYHSSQQHDFYIDNVCKMRIDSDACSLSTGLVLGTGDLLSVFEKDSCLCSLSDNATYRASVTVKYTIIGNVVTLHIPQLSGSITSGIAQITGIPAALYPTADFFYVPLAVISNSAKQSGLLYKQGAAFPFYVRTGADGNLASGTGGITTTSVSWTID